MSAMECHIKGQPTACPCQGEADIMLLVKHHHTDDGGCQETTLAMCHHHYAHYLQGLANVILTSMITGDRQCRRCGKSFEDAKDIFERVNA